jgi:hypothetical protein
MSALGYEIWNGWAAHSCLDQDFWDYRISRMNAGPIWDLSRSDLRCRPQQIRTKTQFDRNTSRRYGTSDGLVANEEFKVGSSKFKGNCKASFVASYLQNQSTIFTY